MAVDVTEPLPSPPDSGSRNSAPLDRGRDRPRQTYVASITTTNSPTAVPPAAAPATTAPMSLLGSLIASVVDDIIWDHVDDTSVVEEMGRLGDVVVGSVPIDASVKADKLAVVGSVVGNNVPIEGSGTNDIASCMLVDSGVNAGADPAVRLAVDSRVVIVVGAVVSSVAFGQLASTEHAQRGCMIVVQF